MFLLSRHFTVIQVKAVKLCCKNAIMPAAIIVKKLLFFVAYGFSAIFCITHAGLVADHRLGYKHL